MFLPTCRLIREAGETSMVVRYLWVPLANKQLSEHLKQGENLNRCSTNVPKKETWLFLKTLEKNMIFSIKGQPTPNFVLYHSILIRCKCNSFREEGSVFILFKMVFLMV